MAQIRALVQKATARRGAPTGRRHYPCSNSFTARTAASRPSAAKTGCRASAPASPPLAARSTAALSGDSWPSAAHSSSFNSSSVRAVPNELLDLAAMDGLGVAGYFRRVVAPVAGPAFGVAAVGVAALALGEVSAGKVVAPPGYRAFQRG